MLKELVRRWLNYKVMVRWLSRFFHYLDRYFVKKKALLPLKEAGITCFRDLVRLHPSSVTSLQHVCFRCIELESPAGVNCFFFCGYRFMRR